MSSDFVIVTDADTDKDVLVLMGSGGGIKAVGFDDATEIYNDKGEMIAKVKQTIAQLAKIV
jgi:hypothetical protein